MHASNSSSIRAQSRLAVFQLAKTITRPLVAFGALLFLLSLAGVAHAGGKAAGRAGYQHQTTPQAKAQGKVGSRVTLARFKVRNGKKGMVNARLVATARGADPLHNSQRYDKMRIQLDKPVGLFRRTSFRVTALSLEAALKNTPFKLAATGSWESWSYLITGPILNKLGRKAISFERNLNPSLPRYDFKLISPSSNRIDHEAPRMYLTDK